MFDRSARFYDLIYSFKDYRREAETIGGLIEQHVRDARAVLDVACGTGEHDKFLKARYRVDGLDLNPVFLDIARSKNHAGSYVLADMTAFDLGRTYDAIICLFSAIGSITTHDGLVRALNCFRRHLRHGGVALVEPWLVPDQWNTGVIHMHTAQDDRYAICRMTQSARRDNVSVIMFHYLVGSGAGIEYFAEREELGLFTREEMTRAFELAGFGVDYDPQGLIGRGMYIAHAP